jgi:hypothetical protein
VKTIQVYDPPMCCSTGLCGTDIDPALVSFAALLGQVCQQGGKVERYNLGQQPMAFVQNPTVKALLDREGMGVLPLIFVGGEVHLKGRYPTEAERAVLAQAVLGEPATLTA